MFIQLAIYCQNRNLNLLPFPGRLPLLTFLITFPSHKYISNKDNQLFIIYAMLDLKM